MDASLLPAFLAELVRRPSINPLGRTDLPEHLIGEARVTAFLAENFSALGLPHELHTVAPQRQNITASIGADAPKTHILWEAHQDTVPVDGMTIDPFGGTIREGRLYGRGACDVKAGIAVMFSAFATLAADGTLPPGVRLTVAFTIDEEHTFLGVQHLARQLQPKPDFAIVAEPTGLDIVVAHKGVARWQLATTGRSCHSARPTDGINAIYRMTTILQRLEALANTLHRTDGPTLSVGRIEGGTSVNTVPDACRIDIDRRLLPHETLSTATAELHAALSGLEYLLTPTLDCPALPRCEYPRIDDFATAIASVCGRVPRRESVPYGTDAGTLVEAGIPAVVFGPGDIAQAHTKDEWVELAQLAQAREILLRFARGLR
ncbi:MAG: M20 family metallopeptidase [Gemmataceae bacterium]